MVETRFSATVKINRSVTEVFDYVSDMRNLWKYDRVVESSDKSTEGPIGEETEFQLRAQMMGIRGDPTIRLLEFDPPHRFLFQTSRFGPVAPTLEVLFEEVDDSTQVTIQGDPNPQGPLRLLAPLVHQYAARLWNGNLVKLKQELEDTSVG